MVAGAENDGFLVRVIFAMHQQPFKQVLAHGFDALRQDQLLFQHRAFVALGDNVRGDGLAGESIGEFLSMSLNGRNDAAHVCSGCVRWS